MNAQLHMYNILTPYDNDSIIIRLCYVEGTKDGLKLKWVCVCDRGASDWFGEGVGLQKEYKAAVYICKQFY